MKNLNKMDSTLLKLEIEKIDKFKEEIREKIGNASYSAFVENYGMEHIMPLKEDIKLLEDKEAYLFDAIKRKEIPQREADKKARALRDVLSNKKKRIEKETSKLNNLTTTYITLSNVAKNLDEIDSYNEQVRAIKEAVDFIEKKVNGINLTEFANIINHLRELSVINAKSSINIRHPEIINKFIYFINDVLKGEHVLPEERDKEKYEKKFFELLYKYDYEMYKLNESVYYVKDGLHEIDDIDENKLIEKVERDEAITTLKYLI